MGGYRLKVLSHQSEPSIVMDYWDRHFATGSPGFQVPADEDDIEEFRSEKSVKTGKVRTHTPR